MSFSNPDRYSGLETQKKGGSRWRNALKELFEPREKKTLKRMQAYEHREQLWRKYENEFRGYIRAYLELHELDYGNLDQPSLDPSSPRMRDLVQAFVIITNQQLSEEDFLSQFSTRISILFSEVTLSGITAISGKPRHIAAREDTQRALNDAAFGVLGDERLLSYPELLQARRGAYETQEQLYQAHGIAYQRSSELTFDDRLEERDAALRYLEQHAPALSERLKSLMNETTWGFLTTGQSLLQDDDTGLPVVRSELERARTTDPTVQRAFQAFLQHTLIEKAMRINGSGWLTYLYHGYTAEDISSLDEKISDKEHILSSAKRQKYEDEEAYQKLRQAYDLLKSICNTRNHERDPDIHMLDPVEINRLATARSVADIERLANHALSRLKLAEETPNLASEIAEQFHVPTAQAISNEAWFSNPEAARDEALRRIAEKQAAYHQILLVCKSLSFVDRTATFDLEQFLDGGLIHELDVRNQKAALSLKKRIEEITRRLVEKRSAVAEQLKIIKDITELTAHDPHEVVRLADNLQAMTGLDGSKDRWSKYIVTAVAEIISKAQNNATSIQRGFQQDQDTSVLDRSLRYPALSWVDKVDTSGKLIESSN